MKTFIEYLIEAKERMRVYQITSKEARILNDARHGIAFRIGGTDLIGDVWFINVKDISPFKKTVTYPEPDKPLTVKATPKDAYTDEEQKLLLNISKRPMHIITYTAPAMGKKGYYKLDNKLV